MKLQFFVCAFLCFTFSACKPNLTTPNAVRVEKPSDKPLNFKYLSAKGKITYQNNNSKSKANIYIRMQKDSLIWLSARLIGVEGFRILVREDSVFMLDRQQKNYYAYSYDELSAQLHFQINYKMIQAILIAENPYPVYKPTTKFVRRRNYFVWKQNFNTFLFERRMSRFNQRYTKMQITEQTAPHDQLTIHYDNFVKINDILLPLLTKANINYTKNQAQFATSLALNFSKLELPIKKPRFPFVISSKYTKK